MYDNIKILSMDGRFLSYVDKKRMSFYLRKNLASSVDSSTIKLNFAHRAEGVHEFFRVQLDNNCVVCGSSSDLTRHHVVPYRFRRHMTTAYKDSNSYDVLRLCGGCHSNYEIEAEKLDRVLTTLVNKERLVDLESVFFNNEKVHRICKRIVMHGYAFMEQPQAIQKLKDLVDAIGKSDIDKSLTIENVSNIRSGFFHKQYNDTISKEIINTFGPESALIVFWRRHFIEYAKPKYLPPRWEDNIERVF